MLYCSQNQPLFLKTYPLVEGEQLLKMNYIVHCSLDAVEEKGRVLHEHHGACMCMP